MVFYLQNNIMLLNQASMPIYLARVPSIPAYTYLHSHIINLCKTYRLHRHNPIRAPRTLPLILTLLRILWIWKHIKSDFHVHILALYCTKNGLARAFWSECTLQWVMLCLSRKQVERPFFSKAHNNFPPRNENKVILWWIMKII